MNREAIRWIGYLEHASNEKLGNFEENVGKGGCTVFAAIICKHYSRRNFSGFPWCATFVYAVGLMTYGKEKACHLLGKPHPGTRVMVRKLRRKNRFMDRSYVPNPGDLIFLHNGDGRVSHCGIVIKMDGDTVITVEGNTVDPSGHFPKEQGGAVAERIRSHDDRSIVGFGKMT